MFIFKCLVPEKYENVETQSIFETRFDMKKIRNEVHIKKNKKKVTLILNFFNFFK